MLSSFSVAFAARTPVPALALIWSLRELIQLIKPAENRFTVVWGFDGLLSLQGHIKTLSPFHLIAISCWFTSVYSNLNWSCHINPFIPTYTTTINGHANGCGARQGFLLLFFFFFVRLLRAGSSPWSQQLHKFCSVQFWTCTSSIPPCEHPAVWMSAQEYLAAPHWDRKMLNQ